MSRSANSGEGDGAGDCFLKKGTAERKAAEKAFGQTESAGATGQQRRRSVERKSSILIIDDSPTNTKVLDAVLGREGFLTLTAANGPEGRELAHARSPDLILLDIMMPGESGFETCRALKLDEVTTNIPVIFVSSRNDAKDKVMAFSLGAVDYVTKPFDRAELLARVRIHIRLKQAIDAAGALGSVVKESVRSKTDEKRPGWTEAKPGTGGTNRAGLTPGRAAYHDEDLLTSVRQIRLKPGEYCVSTGRVVIQTLLGSCVSACLYDDASGIVGMNHFLLAKRSGGKESPVPADEAGKYGDWAMEMLIGDMEKAGARRACLKAKAFGGAFVLPSNHSDRAFCVGEANSRFLVEFLRDHGIPLVSKDLGGSAGRFILFSSEDYSVSVRMVKTR